MHIGMLVTACDLPNRMVRIFALCINEVKKVTLVSRRVSVAQIA